MKNKQVQNYIKNLKDKKSLSWFEKQQYKQILFLLKYRETCDSKYWYKAKEIVEKLGGLEYKDTFISVFDDHEHCLVVFVNDKGKAKTISYDDNFFYQEVLLDTYLELIEDSLRYWNDNNELTTQDNECIKKYLTKYYKYLVKVCGNEYPYAIELENANEKVRALLKK